MSRAPFKLEIGKYLITILCFVDKPYIRGKNSPKFQTFYTAPLNNNNNNNSNNNNNLNI